MNSAELRVYIIVGKTVAKQDFPEFLLECYFNNILLFQKIMLETT